MIGIDGIKHSATLSMGQPGVLHGVRTYILQDKDGQIIETHSISAGLDYPGVGPEHAWLKDSGRAEYVVATDEQALHGFRMLTQKEGIIPGELASRVSCVSFLIFLEPWNPRTRFGRPFALLKRFQKIMTLSL